MTAVIIALFVFSVLVLAWAWHEMTPRNTTPEPTTPKPTTPANLHVVRYYPEGKPHA